MKMLDENYIAAQLRIDGAKFVINVHQHSFVKNKSRTELSNHRWNEMLQASSLMN